MNPSRTYNLSVYGIVALIALALCTLAGAVLAPEHIGELGEVYSTIAFSVMVCAGGGAGAMAYRDSATKGLTSSGAKNVLEAMRIEKNAKSGEKEE